VRFGFDLRPGAELMSPVAALGAERPVGLLPLVGVGVAVAVAVLQGRRPALARHVALVAAPSGVALWVVGLRLPEVSARPVLWAGGLVLLAAFTAVALDLARWALSPGAVARERPPRPVRGDPVPWREVATGGASGLRPWTWWAGCGWAALVLVAWWAAPAGPARPADLGVAGALWTVGVLAAVVAATGGVLSEMSGGTWSLLVGVPRPASRLVAGKLAASGLQALPVLLLAAGLTGVGWIPWAVAAWACLALACQVGALWLGPRPACWATHLGLAAASLALVPALSPSFAPPGGIVSTVALALSAALLFGLAASSVDRRTA
jgi:hypothetical protein